MAAKTRPIFNNFSSGEISPKLDGRIDLAQYFNGVQELTNWICVPQGGAKTRGGFHYVAPTKSNLPARLIPFRFSELQNYMLLFGDENIQFFMNSGQIVVGDTDELVTNGTFAADIDDWDDISTGTGALSFDTDHMEITGGAAGVGWAEQEITTVDESVYILEFDVTAFPLTLRIGSTSGDDDIFEDAIYSVGTDYQILFVADGTSAFIQFKNAANQLAELDNASCQLTTPYEIVSPYASSYDLWLIRFVQDDENLYLVHPYYPPYVLTRGTGHKSFTITKMVFIDGPYEDEITSPEITPSHKEVGGERVTNGGFDADSDWTKGGADWTIADGKAVHAATGANTLSQDTTEANTEIYKVIYTIDSITDGKTITVSIGGEDGTGRGAAGTYTEYITATAAGDLTFTPEDADTACVIDDVSVIRVITLTASADLFDADHVGAFWRLNHTAVYGYVLIESYVSATVVRAIVISVLDDSGSAVAAHREGAWSELNGWPRAICFHEGKLLFASNFEHPQTIWASKSGSGNHMDFTPGVLDNDPYSFTTADLNIIRWIMSGRVLSIGALNAEATAAGPNDGPITATDPPRIRSETTHGSSDLLAPTKVGKSILFLQKAARKVREFVYSYVEDAYGAPDLTMVAEHLFNLDIFDLVYQQEPDSILWALRADGVLLPCAYDRTIDPDKGGIVAWSTAVTDGLFESMESIPYEDTDQIWAVVERTINTATKRYVEYYDPYIWVDSGLTYVGDETATISGLKHLEAKTVAIVGDGATYPSQEVPESGQLTIDPAASEIYVGLQYTPTLVTNRPEVEIAGTSQGLMKSWSKIIVRVLNTMGITINGQVVPARSSDDLMGSAPEPVSGDINVDNLGWDSEGRITIVQPAPLPAHIVSITGDLTVGE